MRTVSGPRTAAPSWPWIRTRARCSRSRRTRRSTRPSTSGRVEPKDLKRLADPAANYPTLNRAVSGLYPPGSTFKPVTALAGIQEGLLNPSSPIQCTGQIEVGRDKQVFKNWDPTKNEPMTLTTALANSCDTYFYEVALRAYERPDSPIQKWARTMGFGVSTGIDVGPESDGLVPTPAWRKRPLQGSARAGLDER